VLVRARGELKCFEPRICAKEMQRWRGNGSFYFSCDKHDGSKRPVAVKPSSTQVRTKRLIKSKAKPSFPLNAITSISQITAIPHSSGNREQRCHSSPLYFVAINACLEERSALGHILPLTATGVNSKHCTNSPVNAVARLIMPTKKIHIVF
jgi:hypothetical protein